MDGAVSFVGALGLVILFRAREYPGSPGTTTAQPVRCVCW